MNDPATTTESNQMFTKAVRKKSKLRLGLTGPSGSGKTYGALTIAKGLGGRVAVIDTETGSASMYAHLLDFDVLELQPPYSPERFIAAVKAAADAGYDTVILDSITHEWSGSGGCLEINEHLAQSRFRGNTWSAWSETTPRHRAFVDALMGSPMHVICTMRSKTETKVEEGGKKVVKLGLKAEQRDGMEYEMTVVLDITHNGHYAVASKDRTGLFTDCDPAPITVSTGQLLRSWLESGAEPALEIGDMQPVSNAETIVGFLNSAARIGSEELKKAHLELRTVEGYAAIWAAESARLKAEAEKADEYHGAVAV